MKKKRMKEKRLDARNSNWPPAPEKSKKKPSKDVKDDWFESIVIRPSRGEPI